MTAARAAKTGGTDRRTMIAAVVFAILLLGVLYWELADPTPKASVPAPIVATASPRPAAQSASDNAPGRPAATIGTTAAALDPTLRMQPMLVTESVVYSGSGRNIFGAPGTEPAHVAAIPRPIAPGRTPVATAPAYTAPTGPPPPPPIDLKFFGTATTADGRRQAFLLHGDGVFLAAPGEIVLRKYKIIEVGPRSLQVEDLTNNNRQTLPLLVSP